MYEDILVPTDGRENTDRAISEAIDLANAHGATLHALYVVNSAELAPGMDFEDLESVGRQAVDYVAEKASDAGVDDVERTVTHGLRHQSILAYADDHGIDLIVMGRHRGIERLLKGGVSDRVSKETAIPVLVVE